LTNNFIYTLIKFINKYLGGIIVFEAIKKYADFSGRARRKEYWLFILLYLIAAVIAGIIDAVAATMGIIGIILTLGLFIPSLSVGVRRLHDINRSGWWMLIGLIPLIGAIVLIVFFCKDGTIGANPFGEDPKSSERQST
jgi:uncharacterized membrane protein YhaH (DUF805 family)